MRLSRGLGNSNYYRVIVEHDYAEVKEEPAIIKDVERVIRLLARRGEMAILLVEQYYDFARSLADHYVVMSRRGDQERRGREHGTGKRKSLPRAIV
jgi:ABC-type branched-subunit amino acid transport system ATPase component